MNIVIPTRVFFAVTLEKGAVVVFPALDLECVPLPPCP